MSDKIVTAALLVIGNEILSGRTQDKNIAYAGQKLNAHGVQLLEVRVVPDVAARIIAALNDLRAAYGYVFTTGGIGPTHDDITSETVAQAFGLAWGIHEEAFKILEGYYPAGEFTPARQKMAMTPEGATLIPNPVSGAPGFRVENVFVMAGVPNIMHAMLDDVAPRLKGGAVMLSETVTLEIAESKIADALTAIQAAHMDVDIGSYPRYENGKFHTALVVRGIDSAKVDAAVAAIRQGIQSGF